MTSNSKQCFLCKDFAARILARIPSQMATPTKSVRREILRAAYQQQRDLQPARGLSRTPLASRLRHLAQHRDTSWLEKKSQALLPELSQTLARPDPDDDPEANTPLQ